MATGVGLRVADDGCTAAVLTDVGELHYIERECVLHMSDDGDTVLGGPAPEAGAHTISGFVARLGDPAGIPVDDGEAYRAEDLVATALFCLINLTTEHLSGAAEFFATHPGDWPAEHVRALREALDYLGLKAVVLTSEADLPSAGTGAPGKKFAYDAARAALTAVLATPAGLTPPDPTTAENSTVVTDVIPAVPAPEPQQAYSAAMPAPAVPPAAVTAVSSDAAAAQQAESGPAATLAAPQTTGADPVTAGPKSDGGNKIPVLVAVAALTGLVLGGIGVAVLLQDEQTPAPPNLSDAQSPASSTHAPPATAESPTTVPLEPAQPPALEPTTTEAPTTTPEPTTTEPSTTEPPVTTTPTPATTAPTTTTRRNPFVPYDPRDDDWRTPYWER
ncbi:MAG TPA: hypothetical protein VK083_16405 [Nocardia sp.]|uniref:hypothetical protein n=1 Tax=Nocardia sp. TaxID=1821 RepID=UPI002B4B05D5|nr:hypothetical protein [Nocardia sp.]HLS78365.1 hypothetical protein [Nocardia sp.]